MENLGNAPGSPGPTDSAQAREQVALASTLMMVSSGLGAAYGLYALVSSILTRNQELPAEVTNDPTLSQYLPAIQSYFHMSKQAGPIVCAVMLALCAVTFVGSLKMKNLEGYGLAMAAAILATVPCFGSCCCFGLPLGIWSLILLNKPEIKSAFRG